MTTLPAGRDLDALLAQAGWVRSLALQLCTDAHAAEDAAQEAWLAAAQRPPRESGRLRGYLARTLRNVLRMNGRASRTRARHEDAAAKDEVHATDTAELVERAELHRHLVAAVLELPPLQRDAVLWHYFEGQDVGALVRRLCRSEHAVRALLRRAREQLRQGLERRGALRSLAAFAMHVPATGALLPAVITGGMLMKGKSIAVAAGVAAAALCIIVPVAISMNRSDGTAAPPAAAMRVVADGLAAEAPAAAPAPVSVREEATDRRLVVRGRLTGLHARLPWTVPLALRATSSGGTIGTNVEVASDGSFAVPVALDARAAAHVLVRADDPWYLPVEHGADVAAGATELVVRVEPRPIVFGTVADEQGDPVVAAHVLAYATSGGVPKATEKAITNSKTATDGSFWLQLAAPADCIVAAVAPDGRADLVPGGSAGITVNGVVELAPIVLPAAAAVTGVVRWQNGAAVKAATVEWRPKPAVALGGEHGLGWCSDGTLTRNRETEVDASGRFTLPARAGSAGNVFTSLIEGNRPADWMMIRPAIAPKEVEVRIAGRPITIRVLKDGAPAPKVGVEWRRPGVANVAANYGTDAHGELKQLVLDESFRVRAVDPAHELVSDWAEFANGPPDLVVLHLQPMPGETVAVRLTGADALTHVAFSWQPAEGPAIPKIAAAEDGKFVMRVPAGRYRLRVLPVQGGQSQYLLRSDHDVVVPAAHGLTLAVQLGGKLNLVVTAADGSFVGGGYRLTDGSGAEGPRPSRDEPPPGRQPALVPFSNKGPALIPAMPPGTYELVLDLGARGEHRQSVEVTANATTDVRIKLP